jgi:hypothetical protein
MDAWLSSASHALAKHAGVSPSTLDLDDHAIETILELARIAAHESGDRRNAPLLCYLAGIVQAQGADLPGLAEAVRRSS